MKQIKMILFGIFFIVLAIFIGIYFQNLAIIGYILGILGAIIVILAYALKSDFFDKLK